MPPDRFLTAPTGIATDMSVDVRRGQRWLPLRRLILNEEGAASIQARKVRVRVRVPDAPGYFRAVSASVPLAWMPAWDRAD